MNKQMGKCVEEVFLNRKLSKKKSTQKVSALYL